METILGLLFKHSEAIIQKKCFFVEIEEKNLILKNILKNLTWFWHNQLAPYLLYNNDDKNDTMSFKKNSNMILNDKENKVDHNQICSE